MRRRNLLGLVPLGLSLCLALALHLESPQWVLLQLGCAGSGAALEGVLVLLTRREYSPWRLLGLLGVLVPEFLALREAANAGFLWQLGSVMYLLLGVHYFLGWLGIWLLFYQKEK